MSMSDRAILDDLTARVAVLEAQVAQLLPKEIQADLYGPEVDHTEDRQARAALAARPGAVEERLGAERRPPGRPPSR